MILGLFHHAGLIYGTDQSWRVLSDETSWLIQNISDSIHMFRMEAFYLISGFFYLLVFSKGRSGFAKERIFRALIPLLFCGLLLNTITNYYSYNSSYEWGSVNYLLKGQWLAHLWFLGNLILYFVISLPLCRYILSSKEMSPKTLMLSFSFLVPFIAVIGLTVTRFTFDGNIIFFSFGTLFYYYSYFILGCFCFKNKELFLAFLNLKSSILFFFIFSIFFLISYFNVFPIENINKVFAYLSTGSLTLSIMSILYVLGSRDSKTIRSFSDSSYTIYVLHQPLIILSYVLIFERLTLGAMQEFLLMTVGVFTICYIIHNRFVKNISALKFLFNGIWHSNNRQANRHFQANSST